MKTWWVSPLLVFLGFGAYQFGGWANEWYHSVPANATARMQCKFAGVSTQQEESQLGSPTAQSIIRSMRHGKGWELARNNLNHVRHVEGDIGVYEDGRVYTVKELIPINLTNSDMAYLKLEYNSLRSKLEQEKINKLSVVSQPTSGNDH